MTKKLQRQAFTLIELLVVIAIISVLIGLLIPAVQKVRAAAARIQCANNLKQVCLATINYATDRRGSLPIALGTPVTIPRGWGTSILPYLEQNTLFDQYATSLPFYDNSTPPITNLTTINNPVRAFNCPSAPQPKNYTYTLPGSSPAFTWTAFQSDYGPVLGIDGTFAASQTTSYGTSLALKLDPPYDTMFPNLPPILQGALSPDKGTKLEEIKDGTSNTVLIAEIAARPYLYQKNLKVGTQTNNSGGGGWGDASTGGFILLGSDSNGNYPGPCVMNCSNDLGLYSFHTGGIQVVLCDGSVHFLAKEALPTVLIALITRSGTEVVTEDF